MMHKELNYLGDQKLKNLPKYNQLIEKESFNFFMTVNNNLNLSTFYDFQHFQILSFSTSNYKDKIFNIYQGFKDFIKPNLMSEEDKCYCQKCKGLREMKIMTKIYSPLIIKNINQIKLILEVLLILMLFVINHIILPRFNIN